MVCPGRKTAEQLVQASNASSVGSDRTKFNLWFLGCCCCCCMFGEVEEKEAFPKLLLENGMRSLYVKSCGVKGGVNAVSIHSWDLSQHAAKVEVP